VTTTGLVVRSGGVTLVPATEIDSPTDTGRTDAPAETGAGADATVGVAAGVAVAVIGIAGFAGTATSVDPGDTTVDDVDGELVIVSEPNPDVRLAAGVPAVVVPGFGAEFAAGVPTVEVPAVAPLAGVVVVGAAGAMLPPVSSPGPAPDGNDGAEAVAAPAGSAGAVGSVCANPADAPSKRASASVALPVANARITAST